MSRERSKNASNDPEYDADPYSTLVPDGEYEVGFRRAEKFSYRGSRDVWAIYMAITSPGEHFGKPIVFFVNAIPKRKAPRPGYRMFNTYALGTGLRPPQHLWRLNPKEFLEGCSFTAEVVAGTRDSDGCERPEAARYSKVKFLKRRVVGTPPCSRRRTGS